MPDKRYGKKGPDTQYPVADWLYGHRLMLGQHWLEYTLEFLNVLAGYGYRLGQGIDLDGEKKPLLPKGSDNKVPGYKVRGRFGLRRFVFYDGTDSSSCLTDSTALAELEKHLQDHYLGYTEHGDTKHALEQVRSLMKSFTVVESGRSWFARSLFPVHDRFLLFESRRVTNKDLNNAENYDDGMRTSDRNFYARGGEIYYLMLSAGTEGHPERREFIGNRIEDLMKCEKSLGQLAELIDNAWKNNKDERYGDLGWLPDKNCVSYRLASEDMYNFLSCKMDQTNAIELMSHLVGFHLIQMLYRKTNQASQNSFTTLPSSDDPYRPRIPIDCIASSDNRAIRDVSMSFFKAQGDNQEKGVRAYIRNRVNAWVDYFLSNILNNIKSEQLSSPQTKLLLNELNKKAKEFFNIKELRGNNFDDGFRIIQRDDLKPKEAIERFINLLIEIQLERFRKTTMGIHGKIGRGIGLIAPKTGRGARYVLGSRLTEALVSSIVPPGEEIEFTRFVGELYERYGLIIGPVQARQSELLKYRQIDRQFYKDNEQAFRRQLHNAGLLHEFSDATAIVVNPYQCVKQENTALV